jgi:hypothetical protein
MRMRCTRLEAHDGEHIHEDWAVGAWLDYEENLGDRPATLSRCTWRIGQFSWMDNSPDGDGSGRPPTNQEPTR